MPPRRRSELYRLGVGVAAAATFVTMAGRAGRPPVDLSLASAVLVAGVLAMRFPIHINLSQKVSAGSAVFFAAALVFPAAQAAALVALVSVLDTCISVAKRVIATRESPPWDAVLLSMFFNAGQLYLSTLAAGLLLSGAAVSARAIPATTTQVIAIVAAAAILHVANLLFVATAVALGTSRSPLVVFRNTHKIVLVEFASLYLVGAAAALLAVRAPWLLMLTLLPSVIIYRSLRYRVELRRESVRAMERMAEEVDSRDPYTFQHSQRVARYCREIARWLGLTAAETELVELAAKVHDIGKIRIPDSILLKPDRLSDEERRVMETHPRLGFEILSQFSEYAKVLELVLTHHERYDGRGYPNRIVGRRLLLIAQVIPVADSLDAMTTARAYRGARSWESALLELQRGSGSQWHPNVVAAAVAALAPDRAELDVVAFTGREQAQQAQPLLGDRVPA